MTTPSGRALLDAVAVMDRLRSPGGCPWDREQTHESLLRYLVEEAYETVDAVAALTAASTSDDPAARADAEHELAEELGDVLLQVLFHARVAQERGAFDVDDVARLLVAKLVRRHPHVFADEEQATGDGVQARWDELKAAEKPARGPVDGIPRHLPALARTDKLLARLERAGLDPDALVVPEPAAGTAARDADAEVGRVLFEVVRSARTAGVDPEAALRAHTDRVERAARAVHSSASASDAPDT
ncbi:MazG family protein [Aquipuribacter nitratireducens]|uniref:MazG family protein n=1 Tax=Aquipuribacter nitratireducens TaxID=650104 RepID=A0ABW0GRX9_9MICO